MKNVNNGDKQSSTWVKVKNWPEMPGFLCDFYSLCIAKKNPYNYYTAEFENTYKEKFAVEELGVENFFTVGDRIRVARYLLEKAKFKVSYETKISFSFTWNDICRN